MKDLNNTVVKNINPEFGKLLLKWFDDQGVDTRLYEGGNTPSNSETFYYGVINHEFKNYSIREVKKYKAKVIKIM